MNVLNRKMFANRDARRKLANMGGIVASSPETLSVAQAYAPGGQVNSDRYVAVIPGVNGGRPVSLSAETLARLQQSAPEVMSRAVVLDAETAAERGIDVERLRPGDAFVERQLSPAPAAPAAPAPAQDDRTIRDVVREGLASSYSVGPVEALMNQINAQGPVPSPTRYGDIKPGQGYDAASLFGDGNIFTNEGTRAGGPGIVAPQAAPVPATETQTLSEALADRPGIRPSVSTSGDQNPMTQMITTGLKSIGVEDPTAPVTMGGIGDAIRAIGDFVPDQPSMSDITPPAPTPSLEEMSDARLEAERISRQSTLPELGMDILEGVTGAVRDTGSYLTEKAGQGAAALGMPELGATMMESAEKIDELSQQRAEAEAEREAATAASVAEVEAEQEARRPRSGPPTRGGPAKVREEEPADGRDLDADLGIGFDEDRTDAQSDDLSSAVAKIVANPDATPDEKNDQTAKTVISGLTGTDTSNMNTKELVNYYKDLLTEMLDESDEDKAEEKWLNMAMIGFAIASGESPSALQNIAGGLLEGTSMMMDQRAEDRKRKDTITTLAIEQAFNREKEDRELDRLLAKETRADKRELSLYVSKLQAKAALDPDVKTYLETADGKAALGLYKNILGNELIDADEVVPTFIQQAGGLAPDFLKYLGLGAGTGGGKNAVTGTTMGDIK